MKIVAAYLAAVLAAYLLGTVFISQGNIAAVTAMGFSIDLSLRIEAAIHDAVHMTTIYLPLVSIALLIGLPCAGGLIRLRPGLRMPLFVLAGFVAMIAIHVIMKAVLGLTGVAPTRELSGLLAQGIAGALGGYVFHALSRPGQAGA